MTDTISTTLNYYNQNADFFIQGTVSVDFLQVQDKILQLYIVRICQEKRFCMYMEMNILRFLFQ